MIKAAVVFVAFSFVYTVIFYIFTPVLDILVAAFTGNISTAGWSAMAVSTYNTTLALIHYGWLWICVLSFLSTVLWYFLYPYREEVLTREYQTYP